MLRGGATHVRMVGCDNEHGCDKCVTKCNKCKNGNGCRFGCGSATNASNKCCATNAVTSATNADGGATNAEMGATNAGVQQMRWGATNATGCNECRNGCN